jgi:hypothetical protein
MSRTSRPTAALGIIVAAALAGAALSGCQTSSEASPSPTATAAPSPTPTTTSAEDEAAAAAKEAVAGYYSLTDAAMQDPESFDAENFKTVTISTALIDIQNTYNVYLANGLHRTGDIKIEELDVRAADLESDPPTVEVTACLDSSEVTVTNKDGKTVEGQEGRHLMRLGVANYEYPNGPWLVAFTESQEGETC